MANAKIQPFTSLNQSKHHCYTLSTTCTLFKLASEVGPRTNIFTAYTLRQNLFRLEAREIPMPSPLLIPRLSLCRRVYVYSVDMCHQAPCVPINTTGKLWKPHWKLKVLIRHVLYFLDGTYYALKLQTKMQQTTLFVIQSTLVISTSIMSNNRLSRR